MRLYFYATFYATLQSTIFVHTHSFQMLSARQLTKCFEPICVYTEKLLDQFTYSREHIVPVSRLKTASAKAELHNVWPCTIGLNIQRSSYKFADGAEMDVCHKKKLFVPPCSASRGIIARTCLRMQQQHDVDLTKVIDAQTLQDWLTQYPDMSAYENRHYAFVEVFGRRIVHYKE